MKLTPLEDYERDLKKATRVFVALGGIGISILVVILLWMLQTRH
jgi:hypothetical protein